MQNFSYFVLFVATVLLQNRKKRAEKKAAEEKEVRNSVWGLMDFGLSDHRLSRLFQSGD